MRMLEIRWHGRGGQGAITVSKVLALAALRSGTYAQAFPEYGPERSGAPVRAYNRLDERPILLHSGVYTPHRVAVLDETLLDAEDVCEGLDPDGALVINTARSPEAIRTQTGYPGRIVCVEATRIAEETGSRFANVPLLGALARTLDFLELPVLEDALRAFLSKRRPEIVTANVEALQRGYHETVRLEAVPPDTLPPRSRPESSRALPPYYALPIGGVITPDIRQFPKTGGWRNERPVFNETLCVNCLLCWAHCPEPAIVVRNRRMEGFQYDYCKGCGICVAMCPTGALTMVPEGATEPVAASVSPNPK
ncbi:2-oxoacid:acceptor oxidoreductase family protein [Rhodothermus profundi]|uniref:Pyruvate ferredoxin oxidoreductase, gamma subunit /pyruvate ferredoxin oxidoreductase, delta subunit n=1 Tax=Rhodothermus profundi TaxID=633813 RepID=A0A1M6RKS8_9BACT|nr:2-oxoacid:acceptor oxidoreductase family protein [Rhodothermus profundi]SHK33039.1 pyruvate ferredoxin oxidoreductase, gamma subunit /pyruvate ferredoxin oxidoreductase, delta subunit [Rhodothermus profundi]